MEIEVPENTLFWIGVAVVAIVILIVLIAIFWPLGGSSSTQNKTNQSNNTTNFEADSNAATNLLISQICSDKHIAIKYEQAPDSYSPQIIAIRPLVQQYEKATGKKFSSNICLQ